jgi:Tol biopolymer transport system component
MSPEQARGDMVDKKADIWAFGVVLFEMLTGRQVFTGQTVSDTLASVLAREPGWTALPPNLHARIRFLLERCLKKEPKNRYHDIADARVEIQEVLDDPSGVFAQPVTTEKPQKKLWVGLSCVTTFFVLGLIIAGAAVWYLTPSEPSMIAHVKMSLQPADQIGSIETAYDRPTRTAIAFSPDGDHIVFVGERGNPPISQLYLRALDTEDAEPLAGTEGAIGAFFSPDGQWIGFWADGELKKVSIAGGPSSSICKESAPPFGVSWGVNDIILFGRMDGGLMQVPASGGEPEALTTLDRAQRDWSHRLPQMLPDGKAVLFTITRRQFPTWDESDIAVQSLESGQRKLLIRGGADGRYIKSGHLVFARKGVLMAAPFDAGRLEMTGDAIAIIENVMQTVNTTSPADETGSAQFTISNTGSLAYLSGGIFTDGKGSIAFVDRHGTIKPIVDRPGVHLVPRFSPDGHKLAFFTFSRGEHSVWIYDLDREAPFRMTKSYGAFPLWTPDGTRLVFENHNLFWQPVDLSTPPEQLTESEFRQFPVSWTSDGKTLIFVQTETSGSHDIWELSLDEDHQPRPLVQTRANEWDATISPDGNWLAYTSDESGREEVYLRPYPGPGGITQVSVDGGSDPAWSRSGEELFYVNSLDESETIAMCVIEITFGPPLKASKPRTLFKGPFIDTMISRRYDVTSDGELFVASLFEDVPSPKMSEMHVVLNWSEELKKKVPAE